MLPIDDNLQDAMLFSSDTEEEALAYLTAEWDKATAFNNRNGLAHLNHLHILALFIGAKKREALVNAMKDLHSGVTFKHVANFLRAYKEAHFVVWGWHIALAKQIKDSITRYRRTRKQIYRPKQKVALRPLDRKAAALEKEQRQCRLGKW